jgi:protein subunit release factor B
MLKFPISEGKAKNLETRMRAIALEEADLEETYFRPSGKGARSRKALTGVMLVHKPSGIKVRCNRERSQGINRFVARRQMVEELEARAKNKTRHEVKAEKIRAEKARKGKLKKKTANLSTPLGDDFGRLDIGAAEDAFKLKLAPTGYLPPGE